MSNYSAQKNTKRNDLIAIVVIAFIVALLIIATMVFLVHSRRISGSSFDKNIVTYFTENTIEGDDGDIIYVPALESLSYDSNEKVMFYNDEIVVYLNGEYSKYELKELAELVNGEICGYLGGSANMIQIHIDAASFSEINTYTDVLMNTGKVFFASVDFPSAISVSAEDRNAWRNSYEDASVKHDWWAKAIGAYEAWEYTPFAKKMSRLL